MAIQTVRAQINGSWHTLTYNSSTGAWEATVTAPSVTSYTQANHYYNVTVEATNTAGTSATADASDLDGLKLYVREVTAPTAAIISPTSGAYVTNNQQPVIFTATDTGSGVDPASLVVRLDGTAVPSSAITREAITDGYRFTYTPQAAMSDGAHTVTVDISDFDGNAAARQTTTFTVDTVDPSLNVTTPSDGFITNTAALTVTGTTNDVTSSPVTVTVALNGVDQGAVTVSGGAFSKAVTLDEGSNTLVVTATDSAGRTTSVTRSVTLDTSAPVIVSATITPNPVDVGQTMLISVVIQ